MNLLFHLQAPLPQISSYSIILIFLNSVHCQLEALSLLQLSSSFFFNSPKSNQSLKTVYLMSELFLESQNYFFSYQFVLVAPYSLSLRLSYYNYLLLRLLKSCLATRISFNLPSSMQLLDFSSYKVNLHSVFQLVHHSFILPLNKSSNTILELKFDFASLFRLPIRNFQPHLWLIHCKSVNSILNELVH